MGHVQVDLVPGECGDAITLVREFGEPKDVKALKNHLMEIAGAVALAFHEEDSSRSFLAALGLYVSHLFSSSGRKRRRFSDFLNVSTSESEALRCGCRCAGDVMTSLNDFTKDEAELNRQPALQGRNVGQPLGRPGRREGRHAREQGPERVPAPLRENGRGQTVFCAGDQGNACGARDEWAEWADQSFTLIQDIQKAVPVLRGKASVDEIKLFKRSLMEIGTAVAQASDEFGDDNRDEGFFGKILGKFSGLTDTDAGHPMNVSASEDSALEKLRAALKGKA
jgi:hypothetical protein